MRGAVRLERIINPFFFHEAATTQTSMFGMRRGNLRDHLRPLPVWPLWPLRNVMRVRP